MGGGGQSSPADKTSKSSFTTKQLPFQLLRGISVILGYQTRAFLAGVLSTFTQAGVFCHSKVEMGLRTSLLVFLWFLFCFVFPARLLLSSQNGIEVTSFSLLFCLVGGLNSLDSGSAKMP